MADRKQIAARHGIPHLADKLAGDTAEALEADAAAKAAIVSLVGGELTYPEPVEPEDNQAESIDHRVERLVKTAETKRDEREADRQQRIAREAYEEASEADVMRMALNGRKAIRRALVDAAHPAEEKTSE